ncbi:hypothetical protein ACN24M_01005 [Streptomyces microflavus]|uniref:ATP-dependent DNA ligase n=1 Tax=Streptomyces microflavus TaxID=1919 RepID=UPI003B20FA7D
MVHGVDVARADARRARDNWALPPGWAAEPKWDGYRALLARYADGRVVIRSRRGTDMTAAFPEITRAAASLPAGVEFAMDGEPVVWEEGRVAFERLQEHHVVVAQEHAEGGTGEALRCCRGHVAPSVGSDAGSRSGFGTQNSTVVPVPGRLCMDHHPPAVSALSRISMTPN